MIEFRVETFGNLDTLSGVDGAVEDVEERSPGAVFFGDG